MHLLTLKTIEEAIAESVEKANFSPMTEVVALEESLGRICASDTFSSFDVPPFSRSTVDGYSVVASDTYGASDSMMSLLDVVGESHMGEETNLSIGSGSCVKIPTGGMMPEGADSNIMVEHTSILDENTVAILKSVAVNENVLQKGEDVSVGEIIAYKGMIVKPKDIGLLAASGIRRLEVYKKPKAYIISTGDEITDRLEDMKKGMIFDINTYTLKALCTESGFEISGSTLVKDDPVLLKQAIESALEISDIVLISGGSSQGEKDSSALAMELIEKNSVFLHGMAIKPGKPTIASSIGGKLVIGLPGQPTSAYMVYIAFVDSLARKIYGLPGISLIKEKFKMKHNIYGAPGRDTYIPVNIDSQGYVSVVRGKSGMISQSARSQGFIIIPSSAEGVLKDQIVTTYLY